MTMNSLIISASQWYLTLPVNATNYNTVMLQAAFFRNTPTSWYQGFGTGASPNGITGTIGIFCDKGAVDGVRDPVININPFSWAANDILYMNGTYEAL